MAKAKVSVYHYDIETGNIINKQGFHSATDAAEELGIARANIPRAIRIKGNCGGFKWSYQCRDNYDHIDHDKDTPAPYSVSKGIKDVIDDANLNTKEVKHLWIKNKEYSAHVYNPEYEKPEFNPDDINWDDILSEVSLPILPRPVTAKREKGIFDRVVFTDTHVGMDVNKDGNSLYGGVWNEEELMKRCYKIIETVRKFKNSNTLIIDDLGDLMDGWDGKTTRKGHDLPQNLTNQEAFDVALKFKMSLISNLAQNYNKVIVNNICESNHGGSFDYILNSALKVAIETMCNNVVITNHKKFINHYRVRNNIFIITHGKDSENLKFGFKAILDKQSMEKIDNYIDTHYLLEKGVKIEFSKGDSHQQIFDSSTSDRFNYYSYMALSPSSNWVQTNFKKGKSGFTFFSYLDTDDKIIKETYFEWKDGRN